MGIGWKYFSSNLTYFSWNFFNFTKHGKSLAKYGHWMEIVFVNFNDFYMEFFLYYEIREESGKVWALDFC